MRRKPFLGALVVKAARKYYCHADSAQSRMFRRRDDDGSLVGLILRLPSARSPHDVDTRDVGSLGSRWLVHSAALNYGRILGWIRRTFSSASSRDVRSGTLTVCKRPGHLAEPRLNTAVSSHGERQRFKRSGSFSVQRGTLATKKIGRMAGSRP